MKMWTLRLGLSLMVVVAFWAKPLPAQEVLVVPTVPYEPAHHSYQPLPFVAKAPPSANRFYLRALNSHGMGCQNDPVYVGCANLHYECDFIFGSCRSFWGESCTPNAPCANRSWQR